MGQAAPIRGLISHKQMVPVRTVLIIISTVLQLTTPDPLFQIQKNKIREGWNFSRCGIEPQVRNYFDIYCITKFRVYRANIARLGHSTPEDWPLDGGVGRSYLRPKRFRVICLSNTCCRTVELCQLKLRPAIKIWFSISKIKPTAKPNNRRMIINKKQG